MDYREDLTQRVLDTPASLCPLEFQDFTIRGENTATVTWNQKMIKDEGFDIRRIRDLAVLLENRAELIGLTSKIIKT